MASAFFQANNGSTSQLYRLGADQSVMQWTANPGIGFGLAPNDLTEFDGNVWFRGYDTAAQSLQLFKLGNDGSVTLWTAINTGGVGLNPADITEFNDALWFAGVAPGQGFRLG